MKLKAPEDYGYVVKNNICLFQKGPLSQWWGGFKGQNSTFTATSKDLVIYAERNSQAEINLFDEDELYTFNCCEQWMMAVKALIFGDWDTFLLIMKESHPQAQKDLGRQIKNYNDQDWKAQRYDVVTEGNYRKYTTNDELRDFLFQFPRHTIFAEASPWDKIWGIGLGPEDPKALDIYQWEGLNILGEIQGAIRRANPA